MVMSNQIVMKNAAKNILDTTEKGNISNSVAPLSA